MGTNLVSYLRRSICGAELFDYWVNQKHRIAATEIQNIDWKAQGKAMRRNGFAKQKLVAKFMSGWCSTGKMMTRWNQRLDSACPRCSHPVEDVDHILTCQAIAAKDTWKASIYKVKEWLNANSSCPDLATLVINALESFKNGERVTLQKDVLFDGVKQVFEAQSDIGWRIFIDGCLSVEWAKIQQIYLSWIGSRRSGQKWVAGLIMQLWNVQWDAWMNRNEALHNTPLAENMSGGICLERALRKEWQQGFMLLPKSIRIMLPKEVNKVLNSGLHERKGWLVLIRRARANIGEVEAKDEFSIQGGQLRKWVGL